MADLRGEIWSFCHSLHLYKIACAERHIRFHNFNVYPDPAAHVLDEQVRLFWVVIGDHTAEVYWSSLFGLLRSRSEFDLP